MRRRAAALTAAMAVTQSAPAETPGTAAAPTQAVPGADVRVLSLPEALSLAREHQPLLRQAHAQTSAARGRVTQMRSGYLPQVAITASYTRQTGNFAPRPGAIPSTGVPVQGISGASYDFFAAGATGTQLIYDFGLTNGKWAAAEMSADAQRLSERAQLLTVTLNVSRAYFQAAATGALIDVARETLKNQLRHAREIEGFVDVGSRPEIDRLQSRTDVANARLQVVTAENDHRTALAQLVLAMGTEDERYEVAATGLDTPTGEGTPDVELPSDGVLPNLVQRALRDRPEMAGLAKQRDAQHRTAHALRGSYGPSIGAAAGATLGARDPSNVVPNWSVGATLTWNVLQGGLTVGQVEEAEANAEAAEASLSQQAQQIRFDVEQAWLSVRAARETLVHATDAAQNARARRDLAEKRYETGAGSILELSDAELASRTAAAQLVQAKLQLDTARATLLAALGSDRGPDDARSLETGRAP
jgi:outer membrane protein TolC